MTERSLEERRASLLAAIDALPRTSAGPNESIPVTVVLKKHARSVVLKAASARRLSISAYMRRAAYAMACHDLGLPFAAILEIDPFVSRENGRRMRDAGGTKFGQWEIDRLVGEVPDERSAED